MALLVKICGLSTPETLDAALEAGADMVGFVFHPRSPRFVTPERAAALADPARGRAGIVALTVDAGDDLIETLAAAVRPDWLQLHGTESARHVAGLFHRPGLPRLVKAVGIAEPADVEAAAAYGGRADLILLDAKAPAGAAYPGGHGRAFDWGMLGPLAASTSSFVLSGGLNPGNVAAAIGQLRAAGVRLAGVDVSSGVERAPGVKDPSMIRDFVAAARAADAAHPDQAPPMKPMR